MIIIQVINTLDVHRIGRGFDFVPKNMVCQYYLSTRPINCFLLPMNSNYIDGESWKCYFAAKSVTPI